MSAIPDLRPRIIPLPPLPSTVTSDIGEAQWAILMAIMDTVVPSLRVVTSVQVQAAQSSLFGSQKGGQISQLEYNGAVERLRRTAGPEGVDEKALGRFLDECPTGIPAFGEVLRRTLVCSLREKEREALGALLTLLK